MNCPDLEPCVSTEHVLSHRGPQVSADGVQNSPSATCPSCAEAELPAYNSGFRRIFRNGKYVEALTQEKRGTRTWLQFSTGELLAS